jgi:multiple sugar transport system permease protein
MSRMSDKNYGIVRQSDFKKPGVKIGYWLAFSLCVLMLIVSVAPIIWIFLSSFKSLQEFERIPSLVPKVFNFKAFAETWKQLNFLKYYTNTFISVGGSIVCAVFFNGLLAYGISKVKPVGSNVIYVLVLWSLMIPTITSIVPLYMNIVKIGLNGSFVSLWLSIGANAFFVILYKNFFDSLPEPIIEAARIDGCSNLQVFFKIVLPLSTAINMVIIIYAITASWSDFLLPYLVLNNTGRETVMVRLFQFRTAKFVNDVMVIRAIVFALIPPIILYAIFQKKIIEGVTHAGIKG